MTTARRMEDRPLHLLVPVEPYGDSSAAEASPFRMVTLERGSGASASGHLPEDSSPDEVAALVWTEGAEGPSLLAGRILSSPPAAVKGAALVGWAAGCVDQWRRASVRDARRAGSWDRLLFMSEQLARADTRGRVFDTVCDHAAALVGGSTALIATRSSDPASRVADWHSAVERKRLPEIATEDLLSVSSIGLLTPAGNGTGERMTAFAPLLEILPAAAVAYAPLAGGAILLIAERRADREFEPDDWYLLRSIASQAGAALRRIGKGPRIENP